MATPTTSPQSPATADLIRHLRADVLPERGGAGQRGRDDRLVRRPGRRHADRLPLFIGGVVILSILLLTVTFRSVTVAFKAGVMNLLSIGAAYGVVAYLAEGGWAGQLVGIDTPTPVPPFIPVIMFAILFGLSMDYEVFLLSRVREEFLAGRSTSSAVTEGLARTARVITAAALIMVAVFGAFALSPEVFLKLIGIGMAAAILIDATIVRMVLVPAVMQLLGDRNWWLPRWIGRLLRPSLRPREPDRLEAGAPAFEALPQAGPNVLLLRFLDRRRGGGGRRVGVGVTWGRRGRRRRRRRRGRGRLRRGGGRDGRDGSGGSGRRSQLRGRPRLQLARAADRVGRVRDEPLDALEAVDEPRRRTAEALAVGVELQGVAHDAQVADLRAQRRSRGGDVGLGQRGLGHREGGVGSLARRVRVRPGDERRQLGGDPPVGAQRGVDHLAHPLGERRALGSRRRRGGRLLPGGEGEPRRSGREDQGRGHAGEESRPAGAAGLGGGGSGFVRPRAKAAERRAAGAAGSSGGTTGSTADEYRGAVTGTAAVTTDT